MPSVAEVATNPIVCFFVAAGVSTLATKVSWFLTRLHASSSFLVSSLGLISVPSLLVSFDVLHLILDECGAANGLWQLHLFLVRCSSVEGDT